MKFCKPWVSEIRQGERVLRAAIAVMFAVIFAGACVRRSDPGFDVVPVPSAAYLTASFDAGTVVLDAAAREGGAVTSSPIKCEPPPDDFEPSEDIEQCPPENDDGWALEPQVTMRHRDRNEDVCCFKRPSQRRTPGE